MPTDAEWGRLYQYDTTGDAGMIMPFRSYYFRNFFPGGWQEMTIGFIYRNSGIGGDYSDVAAERQSENTPANLFHFGMTQSGNGEVPVANNPFFLGIRGLMGGVTQIDDASMILANLKITSVNFGTASTTGLNMAMSMKEGVQASPFAMIGLRFIIDQANNRIYVKYQSQASVALADDAANTTTLTTFLSSIPRVLTLMDGAFPFYNVLNLNAFFIYWPYLKNRLILQCVGAIKLA